MINFFQANNFIKGFAILIVSFVLSWGIVASGLLDISYIGWPILIIVFAGIIYAAALFIRSIRQERLLFKILSIPGLLLIALNLLSAFRTVDIWYLLPNRSETFVECTHRWNMYSQAETDFFRKLAASQSLPPKLPSDEVIAKQKDFMDCLNSFYDSGPFLLNLTHNSSQHFSQ